MKWTTLAVCVALALAASTAARADQDKKYSIADLKALVDQQAWSEAISHLGDIPPTERKADWQDLLGRTAVGFVGTGKDGFEKLNYMIEIEDQYPTVLKYGKYAALRTDVAADGFADCFAKSRRGKACFDYAVKFVDADPANGKLALTVAKAARRGMHASNAIPLFKRAVAANKPDVLCKDPDLAEAIWSAFDWYDRDPAADARELAKTCWTGVRARILKDSHDLTRSDYKKNVCEIMRTESDADVGKVCVESK
jgi:hypothetical protein